MSDADAPSGNAAFDMVTSFFRELRSQGVRHVVISPGSRSTPLTLAAAAHPGLSKQVVMDERSAGFLALGIGRATARPAVLVCTSGTALANYYPAVIEARMSGVPLLLATADRPARLFGTGANQTIYQKNLYGGYPILFRDMGETISAGGKEIGFTTEARPASGASSSAGLDATVRRVTREALNEMEELRGPAHLNFPFDKPLEPSRERWRVVAEENRELFESGQERTGPEEGAAGETGRKRSPVGFARGEEAENPDSREPLLLEEPLMEVLRGGEPPRNILVITGPLSPWVDPAAIRRLSDTLRCPIADEAGIGARGTIGGFEGFLRREDSREKLRPDLIIRFGYQPVSRGLEYALRSWEDVPHLHIAHPSNTHDLTGTVDRRVEWDGRREIKSSLEASPESWSDLWRETERAYEKRRREVLSGGGPLTDLHLYHDLMPKVPADWFRFFSNSFPVRDRLLAGADTTPHTYVNRGASGIDGITSTALGVALGCGRPGVLFTGDLAFLHDSNALLSSGLLSVPLLVVIANNNGGSIFRMLPVAEHRELFTPYFETPQQAEIPRLAEAYGLPCRQVRSPQELREIDPAGLTGRSGPGITLLECKTDADRSMELRNRLWKGS